MDKKGEINFLSKIIRPNLGIITNVGSAHIKNFKNIVKLQRLKEKLLII